MQGLADGYFIIPYTIGDYLSGLPYSLMPTTDSAFTQAKQDVEENIKRLLRISGKTPVDVFHKALGRCIWDHCGMSRTQEGLMQARQQVQDLKQSFNQDLKVYGRHDELNLALEKATRVADFFELGALMIEDALHRNESCGGHFREEHQTQEGEALRVDEKYTYVAAWEYPEANQTSQMHKEPLVFEEVTPTQRSYK